MAIKYAHTNLIAVDWRKLAQFYIDVFACKPQYPERDLCGEWVDKLTNIDDVSIRGIHLSLPGYEDGPTLEIFEYDPMISKTSFKINEQGLGHIAFHVDDVEEVIEKLIERGGKLVGEIIRQDYEGIGTLCAVYAQDPEGNFIEIQHWSK
ncbi:MAG: VOC family protein [Firmicutes bacterium]|nr:VOC family protein [Bacillota bacterium]